MKWLLTERNWVVLWLKGTEVYIERGGEAATDERAGRAK